MEPDEKNRDELLIDYALGELDPEERARVELMLAERPELMREARALKRMVARMGVSMVIPPPRLVSRTRHAAYEARAKRRGWRGLLPAALRRPVTAAAAGLVAVALVVALVGPMFWSGGRDETLTPVGNAATMPDELKSFLVQSLGDMRTLSRGEAPAVEDFSEPAGQAMLLEEGPLSPPQRAVIADIEAVWRHGYDRVNAVGSLSGEIIAELRELVGRKRLVERIEALLAEPAGGR
jgi:hypothetical protein